MNNQEKHVAECLKKFEEINGMPQVTAFNAIVHALQVLYKAAFDAGYRQRDGEKIITAIPQNDLSHE